jgi:hypothetical protein
MAITGKSSNLDDYEGAGIPNPSIYLDGMQQGPGRKTGAFLWQPPFRVIGFVRRCCGSVLPLHRRCRPRPFMPEIAWAFDMRRLQEKQHKTDAPSLTVSHNNLQTRKHKFFISVRGWNRFVLTSPKISC